MLSPMHASKSKDRSVMWKKTTIYVMDSQDFRGFQDEHVLSTMVVEKTSLRASSISKSDTVSPRIGVCRTHRKAWRKKISQIPPTPNMFKVNYRNFDCCDFKFKL